MADRTDINNTYRILSSSCIRHIIRSFCLTLRESYDYPAEGEQKPRFVLTFERLTVLPYLTENELLLCQKYYNVSMGPDT